MKKGKSFSEGFGRQLSCPNRRAQGLPINFVILIALAVLVLVLAGMFFFGGFTSGGAAIDTQAAINRCNSLCLTDAQKAKGVMNPTAAASTNWNFCACVNLKNVGYKMCDDVTSCTVVLGNSESYPIKCIPSGDCVASLSQNPSRPDTLIPVT